MTFPETNFIHQNCFSWQPPFSYFKSANLWSLRHSWWRISILGTTFPNVERGKPFPPGLLRQIVLSEIRTRTCAGLESLLPLITIRKVEFVNLTKNKGSFRHSPEVGTKTRLHDSQYLLVPIRNTSWNFLNLKASPQNETDGTSKKNEWVM